MDKIYVGSGRKKEFQNGGSITTITVDIDDLLNNFEQYGFTSQQGKKKIKLKVSSKREADQYGNTHSVEIDTWKPDTPPVEPAPF